MSIPYVTDSLPNQQNSKIADNRVIISGSTVINLINDLIQKNNKSSESPDDLNNYLDFSDNGEKILNLDKLTKKHPEITREKILESINQNPINSLDSQVEEIMQSRNINFLDSVKVFQKIDLNSALKTKLAEKLVLVFLQQNLTKRKNIQSETATELYFSVKNKTLANEFCLSYIDLNSLNADNIKKFALGIFQDILNNSDLINEQDTKTRLKEALIGLLTNIKNDELKNEMNGFIDSLNLGFNLYTQLDQINKKLLDLLDKFAENLNTIKQAIDDNKNDNRQVNIPIEELQTYQTRYNLERQPTLSPQSISTNLLIQKIEHTLEVINSTKQKCIDVFLKIKNLIKLRQQNTSDVIVNTLKPNITKVEPSDTYKLEAQIAKYIQDLSETDLALLKASLAAIIELKDAELAKLKMEKITLNLIAEAKKYNQKSIANPAVTITLKTLKENYLV